MQILHLLLVVACFRSITATPLPLFDIPINTNVVIRSFIGGPADDDGDERFFENGQKKGRAEGGTSATTSSPIRFLSGITRVFNAINISTREGIKNVAIAALPQIFRSNVDQVGFRTKKERPNPEILKSFRIHADEDAGSGVEAKKNVAKASSPKVKREATKSRAQKEPPFFGSIIDVARVWGRSTLNGFRNFARVAFPTYFADEDKKKNRPKLS